MCAEEGEEVARVPFNGSTLKGSANAAGDALWAPRHKTNPESTMARVSTYLNFRRETEQAFNFYKSVFGTEFVGDIHRFGGMPPIEGQPPIPEADKNLVLHCGIPILGGHMLLGSDAPESMGFTLEQGNNVYINLEPDTRAEADRLFGALSDGGEVEMALAEQFWGDYFGSLKDKFGVKWMINCASKV